MLTHLLCSQKGHSISLSDFPFVKSHVKAQNIRETPTLACPFGTEDDRVQKCLGFGKLISM